MSKTFSENFFGDDLAKLQANYESEMKTVTDDLQKEMKQAGVNIAKGINCRYGKRNQKPQQIHEENLPEYY